MRSVFLVLTSFVFLSGPALPQNRGMKAVGSNGEQRIALIIGNGAYRVAPLSNPVNDARDLAHTLRTVGFSVTLHENQGQTEMKKAIRSFGEQLRSGGVGLFYFAGHGMQVKGQNYLIPVGSDISSESEVEYEAVDAGFLLAQMEAAGNRLNIVILDACRNNPFARAFRSTSSGLAYVNAPSGTLIAYSTAPGSVAADGSGRNSIYTGELLRIMKSPGLRIEDVFKRVRVSVRNRTNGTQTPWEASSLTGDFFFGFADRPTEPDSPPQLTVLPSTPVTVSHGTRFGYLTALFGKNIGETSGKLGSPDRMSSECYSWDRLFRPVFPSIRTNASRTFSVYYSSWGNINKISFQLVELPFDEPFGLRMGMPFGEAVQVCSKYFRQRIPHDSYVDFREPYRGGDVKSITLWNGEIHDDLNPALLSEVSYYNY